MECIITIRTPEWENVGEYGKHTRDELSDEICKKVKKEAGIDFDGSDIEIVRNYDCLPVKGDHLQLEVEIAEGITATFRCEVTSDRLFCDKSWIGRGKNFIHVYFDAVIYKVLDIWTEQKQNNQ